MSGKTAPGKEVEDDVSEEEEKKMQLPFPNATVTREMKKHISGDKMIRKEVKIGMNKFLGEVVKEISLKMDKKPYAMIDYRMFEEAAKPFKRVKELDLEVQRLNAHLDVIIKDCQSIKRDLENKLGSSNPESVKL